MRIFRTHAITTSRIKSCSYRTCNYSVSHSPLRDLPQTLAGDRRAASFAMKKVASHPTNVLSFSLSLRISCSHSRSRSRSCSASLFTLAFALALGSTVLCCLSVLFAYLTCLVCLFLCLICLSVYPICLPCLFDYLVASAEV